MNSVAECVAVRLEGDFKLKALNSNKRMLLLFFKSPPGLEIRLCNREELKPPDLSRIHETSTMHRSRPKQLSRLLQSTTRLGGIDSRSIMFPSVTSCFGALGFKPSIIPKIERFDNDVKGPPFKCV